jgi:hypothetical protein
MPSKVPMKIISKYRNQNMFQTCVPNQKVKKIETL